LLSLFDCQILERLKDFNFEKDCSSSFFVAVHPHQRHEARTRTKPTTYCCESIIIVRFAWAGGRKQPSDESDAPLRRHLTLQGELSGEERSCNTRSLLWRRPRELKTNSRKSRAPRSWRVAASSSVRAGNVGHRTSIHIHGSIFWPLLSFVCFHFRNVGHRIHIHASSGRCYLSYVFISACTKLQAFRLQDHPNIMI
jgi:hypothetical protein